ncbi:MAG: hypothetical protein HYS04_08535 [Acidobacteria bacterium]|nr:hypothetical protein [Acidobacteriota bacterium]
MRVFLVLLLAATAVAADLTGKWSGSFDVTNAQGETRPDRAYMDLKQAGEEVTGTAGPNSEKQLQISR